MQIRTFERNGPYRLGWSSALHSFMHRHCNPCNIDVLHQHGIWSLLSYSVGSVQKTCNTPTIIAAHGMLSRTALQRGRGRKKLFDLMIERRNFLRCRCLHALSVGEAQSMRDHGLTNPIAVIPNGINTAQYSRLPDRAAFGGRFPMARGRRLLLYLSRLHPLKGLGLLAESWKNTEKIRAEDWLLVIAGGGARRFKRRLMDLVDELGLTRTVIFAGPLYGDRKLEALSAASAFVLPSLSEGFPVAVLEAMACGLPAIVTERCNIHDVAEHGAGWVAHPDAASLTQALSHCLSLSDQQRRTIGANGLGLVCRKYRWDSLARQMNEVYDWIVGKGNCPACVLMDW